MLLLTNSQILAILTTTFVVIIILLVVPWRAALAERQLSGSEPLLAITEMTVDIIVNEVPFAQMAKARSY